MSGIEHLEQLMSNLSANDSNHQKMEKPRSALKRVIMEWEEPVSTLHEFRKIYQDRLAKISSRFSQTSSHKVSDISSEFSVKIGELVGSFKRIEAERVRAFEDKYQSHYEKLSSVFSEKDEYELEDQTGKIRLDLTKTTFRGQPFNPLSLPYGCIIMVKGDYNSQSNKYRVKEIVSPMPLPIQQPKMAKNSQDPNFTLICSAPDVFQLKELQLSLRLGGFPYNRVSSVIIIGGLIKREASYVKQFKALIEDFSENYTDIFLMPSAGTQNENPEQNFRESGVFPQKMYHQCFLPRDYKLVGNSPNPQIFTSQHPNQTYSMLVSCGQNLLDLKKNADIKSEVEIMKLMIDFHHLCPSSVFSLPIESYDFDPLVLKQRPNVMVHGKCESNCTEFCSQREMRFVGIREGHMALVDTSARTFDTSFINISHKI